MIKNHIGLLPKSIPKTYYKHYMSHPISNISVQKLLESVLAVSTDDGEKLFIEINKQFKSKHRVELDFDGVELLITTFLNAAIGQLYGKFTTDFIQQNLIITGMANEDLQTLKLVTDRAKQYFKDKRGTEQLLQNQFPDDSE